MLGRNNKRSGIATLISILAVSLSQVSYGQQVFTAPLPETQSQPAQPSNARGIPVEGWAIVRYSVLKNGTTSNVRVVSIAPPAADPTSTIEAVQQWVFTPAMNDGETVDSYNNESVVIFAPLDSESGAENEFAESYAEIRNLIENPPVGETEGDARNEMIVQALQEALAANQLMLAEQAIQMEEIGLALGQATIVRLGLLDFQGAHEFVSLATDPRVGVLTGEDLLILLQIRLQIESQLGRTQDAIETFDRITAGLGADEPNPFASVGGDLQTNWNTAEYLQVLGAVDDQPWRINAGRRMFTFGDVEGSIRSIDAECDMRTISIDFQADVDWALPESWGDCVLFVNASPGTTFSYFELLPAE